ncbi:hypothetical protein [Xanthobacter autotrophicus]|uniref:hypothetical protein n=1 Tax=Xanthobacter autotrophicus TaxID=280 RepID=UPI00372AF22F
MTSAMLEPISPSWEAAPRKTKAKEVSAITQIRNSGSSAVAWWCPGGKEAPSAPSLS